VNGYSHNQIGEDNSMDMDEKNLRHMDEFIQYIRETKGFKTLSKLSKNDLLQLRQRIAEEGVELTPGELDELCNMIIYVVDNLEDY